MTETIVGKFKLIDPPPGQEEIIRRAIELIDFRWERLDPAVQDDYDKAVLVEWDDTGQGTSGLAYGRQLKIVLSTRNYHLDWSAAFVFAHEVGHIVDAACLRDQDRQAIMDLTHSSDITHQYDGQQANGGEHYFSHNVPHSEEWVSSNDYLFRHNESYADLFVATFAPTIWDGTGIPEAGRRYPRFVHWTDDHDEVRRLTLWTPPPAIKPKPEPEGDKMQSKRLTVGSFNIYKKLGPKQRLDDLGDLLAIPGLDVAGLQEIDWTITHKHLPVMWDVHQVPSPLSARKDPILFRRGMRVLDKGVTQLHDAVRHNGKVAPARHAHWLVTEEFIWINFHLNADVEHPAGHPKRDSPRPESNHRMMKRAIALADDLQAAYDLPVFISMDSNVDFGADKRVKHRLFPYVTMTHAGFKCCWDGRAEESTRTNKPVKGRTIDHIWARGTKTHKVVFTHAYTPNRWGKNDPVESDHLAVIAHAMIKLRLKPWLFNLLGKRKRR